MHSIIDREQVRVGDASMTACEERIGHVNLRVADLKRATDFYCGVLGLRVVYYGPAIGVPTVFLAFGKYHHHVALNWFYSDSATSKHVFHNGLNHFAIVYPNELSLARTVSRLLEYGHLIYDARDHGATLSVYLQDPDGNGIELYYDRPRTQWFDSEEQLVIKSEPFDVVTWLEGVWAGPSEVPHELPLANSQEVV